MFDEEGEEGVREAGRREGGPACCDMLPSTWYSYIPGI